MSDEDMMIERVDVLAISGSLRRDSYNSAALRACQTLAPEGMTICIYDRLADLPHYNDDVRAAGFPPVVDDLRRRIRAADALLIATPEYNHSIPGVLKNAIDWASRPPEIPLLCKSVAILGCSMGMLGTARAQYHMRDIFVFFDAKVLNKPEVFVATAQGKFDADGTLKDEPTATILRQLLAELRTQTLELKSRSLATA